MARAVKPGDGYLEALVKNLPSEMIATYMALSSMLLGITTLPKVVPWIFWGIFLVCTPIYLWSIQERSGDIAWWQIWIVSPIAFFAWSLTAGGVWASVSWAGALGGILVILLSGLIFPLVSRAIAKL